MPHTAAFWEPWQPATAERRYRVIGRNARFGATEIGFFFALSPLEAVAQARKRSGHLCGGLHLEAEAT